MSAPKCCALCGVELPASKPRVYSRFTGSYYCANLQACARNLKRAQNEARRAGASA